MPHFNKLLPVRKLLCQTKRSSLFCQTKRTHPLCQTKRTLPDSAPCVYFFKWQVSFFLKKSCISMKGSYIILKDSYNYTIRSVFLLFYFVL